MTGVHIRPAEGGYILDIVGRERIATTLDDVLTFLVFHFEGIEDVTIHVMRSELVPAPAPPDPVPEEPRLFTCPICYRSDFKRLVGVIGHARGRHGQTLTAKDLM